MQPRDMSRICRTFAPSECGFTATREDWAAALAVGLWQRNRAVLRIAGIVSVVGAVTLLVAMGVFTLDTMQMRATRVAEDQAAVVAGGLFQDLKYLIASLVLGFLGLGSLQTAKEILTDERSGR